ncbi:MAG: glycyl-radical enzyme activating protein [Anaerostipes sp.]|nr:glycyl-radical enzyme activating protein [Anaerostipes sp.]
MKQQMTLSIMEIERFAIHDGPGIRSTVFLQGCPLHCPWCANPESQRIGSKLMYYENSCVKCGKCAAKCPQRAIEIQGENLIFHREKCIQCRTCEKNCLQNAIHFSGVDMKIDNIVETVMRDLDYYEESGGGVTISGGECFVQFDGFLELIQKLKKKGLHVAVETCGQTALENIKKAFPYIDLFLFDFKHPNPEIFHQVTGGNLEIILKNMEWIAKEDHNKIVIRVPVIPEFNDNETVMRDIFCLVKKFKVQNVQLLPYHVFGINKYKQLGMPYEMAEIKSLTKEDLIVYEKIGENLGLNVKIGG